MDKNKIIEKIAKLMAMGNSTNPNEAAIALARAQKLMQEYQLTTDDVQLQSINEDTQDIPSIFRSRWLYSLLCNSISSAFGIECVFISNRSVVNKVTFIGPQERVAGAGYAFTILSRQANFVKREFNKEFRAKHASEIINQSVLELKLDSDELYLCAEKLNLKKGYNFNLETFKRCVKDLYTENSADYIMSYTRRKLNSILQKHSKAYLLGWLRAINEKVVKFAINHEEQLLIEQYIKTQMGEITAMRQARTQRYTRSEMEAFTNGVKDGQNGIDLLHGINGTSHAPLQINMQH